MKKNLFLGAGILAALPFLQGCEVGVGYVIGNEQPYRTYQYDIFEIPEYCGHCGHHHYRGDMCWIWHDFWHDSKRGHSRGHHHMHRH